MGQRAHLEPSKSDLVSTVSVETPIYLLVAIGLVMLGIFLFLKHKRYKRRRSEI